jgi:hypothetical protein
VKRILKVLQNVHGTEAMSQVTVFQWWKLLKMETKGWLVTLKVGGRLSIAVTDVNIDIAEQLLEDRRLSLMDFSGSLNVSLERVHYIVTVELGAS